MSEDNPKDNPKDEPDALKEFLQELFRAKKEYLIDCKVARAKYERKIHKAGVKYMMALKGGEKEKNGTKSDT